MNCDTSEAHTTATAATVVRQARTAAGITQRELARRADVHQPNIAAIESTARGARFDSVASLVRAAGGTIAVLPTTASTVADVAGDLRGLLQAGAERRAYRTVLGLHDELVRSDPATRVTLCLTPPEPVGDARYDALLAGLVEHVLETDGLPVPTWTSAATRTADDWYVEDLPVLRTAIRRATPPAFARHGVWIDGRELDSV